MADLVNEGSLAGFLTHPDPNWSTTRVRVRFPEISKYGIKLKAAKEADGTLLIHIGGPFRKRFKFTHPLPPVGPDGVHMCVTWTSGEVNLYLNGDLVETKGDRSNPPSAKSATSRGARPASKNQTPSSDPVHWPSLPVRRHKSDSILTDRHLRAIGRVCVAWSWLETHADGLLATLIPMVDLIDARAVTANSDLRDKLAMIRALSYARIPDQGLVARLDTLINYIDNDLRNARNGIVHQGWAFDRELKPAQHQFKFNYKKPQSRQPKAATSYEETSATPENINLVADQIDDASHKLAIALTEYLALRPPSPSTL